MNKQQHQGALASIMFGPSFMSQVRARNPSATKMDTQNSSSWVNWSKIVSLDSVLDSAFFSVKPPRGKVVDDGR